MEFTFSTEQLEVAALARQILEGSFGHEALTELERSDVAWDRESWRRVAEAGLLGIGVDEKDGGIGLGFLEACSLFIEAGRTVAPLPLASGLAAAWTIAKFGSEEQQRRWLPDILEGSRMATVTLPGASGHVSARRTADGWVLNGEIPQVPFGYDADATIVVAAVGERGSSASFLVESNRPGVDRTALADPDSHVTGGEPRALVRFDDVSISDDARFSRDSGVVYRWLRDRLAIATCATQVGIIERALELTADYTSTRQQFGRPIGSFQAVATRAADAYIDVQSATWTMWRAAWRLSEGLDSESAVHVARFWACEAGHRVLSTAQHLHGGLGVDVDYALHRYFVRGKQNEFQLGGSEAHLAALGSAFANPEEN